MYKSVLFASVMTAVWVFGPTSFAQSPGAGDLEIEVVGSTSTLTTTSPAAMAMTPPPTNDGSSQLREDLTAVKAAEKIAPAPGESLVSTEQRSLSTNNAVAPAPALQFKGGDTVVLHDGDTSEALAVKSGAELLKMLGLRPKARPTTGLESEETTVSQLFDEDAVRKLIAAEPTVVYRIMIDGTPLPDPMIVPWIRNAKVLQETFDLALEKLQKGQLDSARQDLLNIINEFPDTEYAKQASEIILKIKELTPTDKPAELVATKTPPPIEVGLNPDVKIGTVVADTQNPENNRAMINGRAYRAGEPVRGYPDHLITQITEDAVTIEVEKSGQKKSFTIPVRSGGNQ